MTDSREIATPLGTLTLSLACGDSVLGRPDREAVLSAGARVAQWRDVAGLDVDLLVTRYDALVPIPAGWPRCVCWGAEWRLYARGASTPGITIGSLLPLGIRGTGNGDELITMTEVVTDRWCLTVAGLDDDWYDAKDRSGLLAPSWAGRFAEWSADRGFDGVQSVERGIRWQLPGLRQGEAAKAYTTVAWCRAGGEREEDAPTDAVDVRPEVLLRSAGIRVFDPADRWNRKASARAARRPTPPTGS